MAPKSGLSRSQKMADSKAATKILSAFKDKQQVEVKKRVEKRDETVGHAEESERQAASKSQTEGSKDRFD